MSSPIIIRADGMEWTLQTFIDAYGFTRTDELNLTASHPLMSRDEMLDALTASGELITGKPARHLPWGEVIAIKGVDGGPLQICDYCGEMEEAFETGNGKCCHDCFNDFSEMNCDGEPDGGAALAAARNAEGQKA